MFFSKSEVFDKILHRFKTGKNCVLSSKGIFPEEDFEGGLLFVLVLDKIGVGTSELIEVIVEKVNSSKRFGEAHLVLFNRMINYVLICKYL